MAYGNQIQPGVEVEGANLIDLAPTILHLMDEPVSRHMDGRVLHEIARPEVDLPSDRSPARHRHRQRNGTTTRLAEQAAARRRPIEEDQKLLADRLRSLGYVG